MVLHDERYPFAAQNHTYCKPHSTSTIQRWAKKALKSHIFLQSKQTKKDALTAKAMDTRTTFHTYKVL